MPLTYQPFADGPEIREQEETHKNTGKSSRLVSALAGLGLIAAGFVRRGTERWLLFATGATLVGRGWTGRFPWDPYLSSDGSRRESGVLDSHGIRMEESIEVRCSPDVLYRFWRDLEELPRVMRHVESVQQLSDRRSHWKVKAPAGMTVEWDAEIINEMEGRLIAWQSLPGAAVRSAGSVRFEPKDEGITRVKVAFEYDPPAGAFGAMIASLLGHSPRASLTEDLARFKEFAERELAAMPV